MDVKLGQKATDIITGFTGVVVGKIQYLTGCNQALLLPRVKADGTPTPGEWMDEDRLTILDEPAVELPVSNAGADNTARPSY